MRSGLIDPLFLQHLALPALNRNRPLKSRPFRAARVTEANGFPIGFAVFPHTRILRKPVRDNVKRQAAVPLCTAMLWSRTICSNDFAHYPF